MADYRLVEKCSFIQMGGVTRYDITVRFASEAVLLAMRAMILLYMLHIIRNEHTEKTLNARLRNDTGGGLFLFFLFPSNAAAILERKVSMFGPSAPFLPIDFSSYRIILYQMRGVPYPQLFRRDPLSLFFFFLFLFSLFQLVLSVLPDR